MCTSTTSSVFLDVLLTEQSQHLRLLFKQLETYKFKLSKKKCHFMNAELDHLGYAITGDRIYPQPSKIAIGITHDFQMLELDRVESAAGQ